MSDPTPNPNPTPPIWENKIVGHAEVEVDQLLKHPLNWRIHTNFQRAAVKSSIRRLGYIRSITVSKLTGVILDGHLRVELALEDKQTTVPVEYVMLSEEDERLALMVLDPLSALAEADRDNFAALQEGITLDAEEDAALLDLIQQTEERAGLYQGYDYETEAVDEDQAGKVADFKIVLTVKDYDQYDDILTTIRETADEKGWKIEVN